MVLDDVELALKKLSEIRMYPEMWIHKRVELLNEAMNALDHIRHSLTRNDIVETLMPVDKSKRFVVKLSVEGVLVGLWLKKDNQFKWAYTESLEHAADFETVERAHHAMGEALKIVFKSASRAEWFPCLGYEVRFRGLCTPNPC